jgi:hypothetical protein
MTLIECAVVSVVAGWLVWDSFYKSKADTVTNIKSDDIIHHRAINPFEEYSKSGYWSGIESHYVIFLDFDGVLHEGESGSLKLIINFEKVLRLFPDVKVIFSTSWRWSYSFERLVKYFSMDVRDRFVGYTGDVDPAP